MSSETCVQQCFKCSLERIFKELSNVFFCYVRMSTMSKCPRCLNVQDVQMSMMWSNLSHVVTLVTCGHTCHMWSQLSHVVTLVTCGHICHMWSQLSHVVTFVTCGHICHMWSHLSHVVTLVMRNQCFNC